MGSIDEVGKISLGIEINGNDISKQLDKIASSAGTQFGKSFESAIKSINFKPLTDGITTAVKELTVFDGLVDSIKGKLSGMKLPTVSELSPSPTAAVSPSGATRQPKSFDAGQAQAEIDHLTQVMDNVNAKIELQQRKLKALKDSYESTFNDDNKAKIQEKILNTEAAILRLTKQSENAASKIWQLDDAIKKSAQDLEQANEPLKKNARQTRSTASGNAALIKVVKQLTAAIKHLSSVTQTSSTTTKQLATNTQANTSAMQRSTRSMGLMQRNLRGISKATKESSTSMRSAGKSAGKMGNQFTQAFSRIAKQVLVFGVLYKAIRGFQSYLHGSMKTNSQYAASLNAIKTNLATAFQPVFSAVMPAINSFMSWLAKATAYVAAFMSSLFGASYKQSFAAAKGMQAARKEMDGYGKSAKKAGKEIKGLSALDEFNLIKTQDDPDSGGGGGAAGDFNMELPDLDIDGIQSKTDRLVAGMKSAIGSVSESMKNMFADWNIEPLKTSLKELYESTKPFAKNIGTGLKWFLLEVLAPLGKWTVTKALPTFLDLLSGGIRLLTAVIEAFAPYGIRLYEGILKPLAQWTGGLIISALKLLVQGFNSLSDWIKNNQEALVKGTLFIASFFAAFKIAGLIISLVPLIANLGALIATIVSFIASGAFIPVLLSAISAAFAALMSPIVLITAALGLLIYSFIDLYSESETFRQSLVDLGKTWLDALQPLANFVKTVLVDAWEKILKPVIDFFINTLIPNLIEIFKMLWEDVLVPLGKFLGTVLKPVFQILADLLLMIWKNIVLPLADAIGSVLAEAWDGLYSNLTKKIIPIIKTVITVLQWLWDKAINPLINHLWDRLKPSFDTVFTFIKDIINGLKDILVGVMRFIIGVFTGDWKKAWEGIKLIFKGIWESLVGIVKGVVNTIIDLVNRMIKGINLFSVDIPDWVATLTGIKGGKFGFNIPEIPKLANGGLVSAPTLAMVGDNRNASIDPEVVTPLSKLQGMLDSGNAEVVAVLMLMLDVLREISRKNPSIKIGETELARAIDQSSSSYYQRTGLGQI